MIFHSSFLMERRAFVKPNYLVFMKNVRKYLGLVSMSLVCASPLAAMVIQPFVGVTIVQQNVITVKGQVMDEKGEAIIGANVIVEGTAQGMITDMNGNFSFQCPVGAILKVSYIGYLSQTIKVSGNAGTLKVILKEDAETLDEVVVVGYGMVKKSDLTGSVASVNVDEMAKRNPVNIGQALQGAAAGVQVMRNGGDPSGETTIRIRGIGTVQGSADPLYVIDGIISSASMVNPADIASIEVLKDASATAIYGSRAANGVVMITTKQGDKNKSRINFTANLSVQSVNNTIDAAYPDLFTPDYIFNAVQYLLGMHPGRNQAAFVTGVGAETMKAAYGVNRADWSYIPGGVSPGTNLIRPDLPELLHFPFLWQEGEYCLGGHATWFMYMVLASNKILNCNE